MRVLELTGPTGAGKSAIYAEMLKFGGFAPNPNPTEAAAVVEEALTKWPEVQDFVSLIGMNGEEPILGGVLGWMFRTAQDHDGRLKKRLSGTLRAFAKVYMARTSQDPKWMVIDGGLIHRGQGIDRLEPKMPVHRYFELMPLPDVVFAIWCQPEALAERNRTRGGNHDRTEDLERQWQCHNLGLDILKRRGVQIVPVDTTTLTPEKAAHAILVRLGLIRKYDGDHAANYEASRKSQAKWDAEQRIIETWLEEMPAGTRVLDAPCGTGRFFDCYQCKGFIVRGLDAEADMIAQAGRKIANKTGFVIGENGPVAEWGFIHGDIRNTKQPNKSFDVAVCVRITRWIVSQYGTSGVVTMLREMQRVTRKCIIFTVRVRNHEHAIPYDVINGALDGWCITRDEPGAAGPADAPVTDPDYRILMAEPA